MDDNKIYNFFVVEKYFQEKRWDVLAMLIKVILKKFKTEVNVSAYSYLNPEDNSNRVNIDIETGSLNKSAEYEDGDSSAGCNGRFVFFDYYIGQLVLVKDSDVTGEITELKLNAIDKYYGVTSYKNTNEFVGFFKKEEIELIEDDSEDGARSRK
jgi:hypothetical protein